MKKNILYLLLGILALTSSCQDPEYVLPTADRQGITSLTALFTSGPYVDKEAVVYTIADASVDKYVIPMPWYYPENSDNENAKNPAEINTNIIDPINNFLKKFFCVVRFLTITSSVKSSGFGASQSSTTGGNFS